MNFKNKTKLIVLAVVLCLVLAAGAAAAIILNRPANIAALSVKGAISDLLDRKEVAPAINMLEGGSLYAEYGGIKSDDWTDEDITFSGKLYFSEDALMAEDVTVKVDELKFSGEAYVSGDLVYLSESEVLGEAYGLYLPELADELKNSIFAYGSGSDYEIADKEVYDALIEALENYNLEGLKKDGEAVAKKMITEFWKIVCEHAEFEVEKDKMKFDDKKVSVRVITMTIDGKAAANIVSDMYDFLCKDDTINDFLDEYNDAIVPLLKMYGMEDIDDLCDRYEEALEKFDENLDSFCDDIEDNFDKTVVEIVTPKFSTKLLKLTIKDGSDTLFSIKFDKNGAKKSKTISVKAYGDEVFSFEVVEDSKDTYKAKINVDGSTITIIVNKEKDTYTLKIDDELTVQGDFEHSRGTTTLTVDKITSGEYNYTVKATLIITEKDKMPSAPDTYTTISDITSSDIEKWMERLEEIA